MELQQAIDFFAELYYGEHHIPTEVRPWGSGYFVAHKHGDIATYDFNMLTRLVLMAHDKCIRASIAPHTIGSFKICIFQRDRTGGFSKEHPTIEQAIEDYNKRK